MSEGDLYCSICERNFSDPRLLPCFHTFCRQCLNNTITTEFKDGMIACPLCQEKTKVPRDGANGFQVNTFLRRSRNSGRRTLCKICDDDYTAEYECHDCNKYFCRRCLSVHNKVEGAGRHVVVPLSSTSHEICRLHPDDPLKYYCKSCKDVICGVCITKYHKDHDIVDAETAAYSLKSQIKFRIDDDDVSKSPVTRKEAQKIMEKQENEVIEAINVQTKIFKDVVDEVRRDFTRQLLEAVSDRKPGNRDLNREIDRSYDAKNHLQLFAKAFVKNANDYDVIKYGSLLDKKLNEMDISRKPLNGHPAMKFTPKEISFEDIKNLFGFFTPSMYDSHSKGKINVLRHFGCTTINNVVTSITCMPDNTVWVCFGNNGVIENYAKDGTQIRKVNVGHRIDDSTCTSDGVLYLTCNGERKIASLNKKSSNKLQFYIDTEMCVRGIDIDDKDQLLVGLTERDVFYNADRCQAGSVATITRGKTIVKMYSEEHIQYPARIAVNKIGDVAVCDWINLAVLIFRVKKKIGHFDGKADGFRHFTPRGICATRDYGFMVVDTGSNYLHWISETGKVRQSFDCTGIIPDPYSIAVDNQYNYWVATRNGKVVQFSV